MGRRLRRCVKSVMRKLHLYRQRLQIGPVAEDLFSMIETYIGYNLLASCSESFAPRRIRLDYQAELRDRNSEFRIPNSELR